MKNHTALDIIFHIEDKIREYEQKLEDTDKSYSLIRGSLTIQIKTLEELVAGILDGFKKQRIIDSATLTDLNIR